MLSSFTSSSLAAAPPPPLSKPTIPTPTDPSSAGFIPWGTLATYILPWINVALGAELAVELPPWTLWLESWYQAIDPWTWTILEQDDVRDLQAWYIFYGVEEKLLAKEEKTEEEREELDRVVRAGKELLDRMSDRCGRLYGLSLLRKAFLAHQRTLYPLADEADLLPQESTSEDVELHCPFAAGSVWPLPIPHPLRDECTCDLHVYSGSGTVNFFRLPDTPGPESSRLGIALFGHDPSSTPLPPLDPPPPSLRATPRKPSSQNAAGVVASSWTWATRKLANTVGVH